MLGDAPEVERSYDAVGQFAVFNLFITLIINAGVGIIAAAAVVPLTAAGMPAAWEPAFLASLGVLATLGVLGANFWLINMARADNVQGPILFAMGGYAVIAALLAVFLGIASPVVFGVMAVISMLAGG